MKWITRERPKTDRIACPWLIKRFIDHEAEIIFVPADQVLFEAERLKATPFDAPCATYTQACSQLGSAVFTLKPMTSACSRKTHLYMTPYTPGVNISFFLRAQLSSAKS